MKKCKEEKSTYGTDSRLHGKCTRVTGNFLAEVIGGIGADVQELVLHMDHVV